MGRVCFDGLIALNRLRAEFPFQAAPPFGYTDFIGEYATAGLPRISPSDGKTYSINDYNLADQGQMEFDPIGKVVYPRAMFVAHDQAHGDGYGGGSATGGQGNPAVLWDYLDTDDTAVDLTLYEQSPGFDTISLKHNQADKRFTIVGYMPDNRACQGFTAMLRAMPQDPGMESYYSIRWRVVGPGLSVIRWYSVAFHIGSGVRFGYNDSIDANGFPLSTGWVWGDHLRHGASRNQVIAPSKGGFVWVPGGSAEPPPENLEVRLIAGQMRVWCGSETTPFVWPHTVYENNGNPTWLIDLWEVTGHYLRGARWDVHPTKFHTEAAIVSDPINCGFPPEPGQLSTLVLRTHLAPNIGTLAERVDSSRPGWLPAGTTADAFLYGVDGTNIYYRLMMTNTPTGSYRGTDYADYTAAVRAVSVQMQGLTYWSINPPTVLGTTLPNPERFRITHTFDLNSLSIQSSISATFSNFRGQWTNWFGSGVVDTNGHLAIAVDLGIQGGVWRREFTGIFNTSFTNGWGGQGKDSVVIQGKDFWAALDRPVWNLPWFDGMNVYWVMGYLAALGGISPYQLEFAGLIPANPYDYSPGMPLAYQRFLPIGVSGSPLTRFGGGQRLRDIMLKISKSIGFCLYFNVFGRLNFHKFWANAMAPPDMIFTEAPGSSLGSLNNLGEVFSGSYSGSLEAVRNSVTVIGVNAFGPVWQPIVFHDIDIASIYDDTVANYKGFHDPVVWADTMFTDPWFAAQATQEMLAYLRLPDRQVSFTTWYPQQPIYPGSIIRVQYTRSGVTQFPFFVTQTETEVDKANGSAWMTISGRLVPMF